ncbi:MAG: hypothetical protein IJC39_00925 [Firmicutes bacterium]|nr:hypothetical protein [Bacillota bacterium]
MGFGDSFGDKLQSFGQKTAELAKEAARKSGDMVEIGKLKKKISDNEKMIRRKYMDIGKFIYAKYTQGDAIPSDIQGFVDIITVKMSDIELLREKIQEIKEKNGEIDNKDAELEFDEEDERLAIEEDEDIFEDL